MKLRHSAKLLFRFARVAPLFVLALPAVGNAAAEKERPTVIVAPRAVVRSTTVQLKDVAQISADNAAAKVLAARLATISLGDAPPPRATRTIVGPKILSLIKEAGISPDTIGYSIPNIVTIEREGRLVTAAEVTEAVRAYVRSLASADLQVKSVELQTSYAIPTGPSRLIIEPVGKASGGKLPLQVEVLVNDEVEARFLTSAQVDHWQEIPVLSRTVERGMVIGPHDLQMVRLNLKDYGDDVVTSAEEAIGYRAKSRLSAGEAIRRAMIDIPPVIEKGSRITMIYSGEGISATARGIALENGFSNGQITVQNDSSRKMVRARVVDRDTVEVGVE